LAFYLAVRTRDSNTRREPSHQIAGCSAPRTSAHFKALKRAGVTLIVNTLEYPSKFWACLIIILALPPDSFNSVSCADCARRRIQKVIDYPEDVLNGSDGLKVLFLPLGDGSFPHKVFFH
jgi:hypothetical protein